MSNSELPSSFLTENDLQYPLFPDIADLADELELSPLDRWQNSPPEAEAAEISDIVSSVRIANSQGALPPRSSSQDSNTSHRRRQSHRQPASVATSGSSRSSVSSSSASSAHSVDSNQSGSFGRFYAGVAKGHRRRRQRNKSPVPKGPATKTLQARPYQCTFCTDTFKQKHDWVRHEKSLHLSLENWTCTPLGPTFQDGVSSRCVFCSVENPSEAHTREHRFWECQEKPSSLRTFYRKDHLFQHLRLVHGTDSSPFVEAWRSKVKQINSRCGFCAATFTQWADRNSHIAVHFREGLLMKDWKGCRGLDPAAALAVENAMPPYLIGAESTGIEPFSASNRRPDTHFAGHQNPKDECHLQQERDHQPTPFELLTEHLIRFVREKQAIGDPILDDSIQREARSFVYGDEDPWNQTAADNPDWLQLFKDGMGVGISSIQGSNVTGLSSGAPFPLPWEPNTTGSRASKVPSGACARPVEPPMDPWMPWAWQSPECLAEFRRSNQHS